MLSDIEIAQKAKAKPIGEIASKLGIPNSASTVRPLQGQDRLDYVNSLKGKPTQADPRHAISPTPAGEGKTTTTVGLGDALNHIGKKAIICLREPSLGPCSA